MRIAINGRLLIHNQLEGIGYFTWEVLKNMVEMYPEHDYLVLFDRKPDRKFLNTGVEYKVLRPAARHPILYKFWFEVLIPLHLRMWDAEIFLSFDGFTSLNLHIPVVTVIHDLAYLHFPEYMKRSDLKFYQKNQPKFAGKSSRVLTVSEYSALDLRRQYGLRPERIEVVYNGSRFESQPPQPDPNVLERFDVQSGQYIIYTGSLHPRKNIVRLIQAFEKSETARNENIKLVLVGRKAWDTGELFANIERSPMKDRIIHTGYLADEDLWSLLRHAMCLCYVSLFEGFGVPVLDAFHAEVPVICSNSTSLKEIAGEAAVLVNENNPVDIARALDQVIANPRLRELLVSKERERRQLFSWRSTTRKVFASVHEVYNEHYRMR